MKFVQWPKKFETEIGKWEMMILSNWWQSSVFKDILSLIRSGSLSKLEENLSFISG